MILFTYFLVLKLSQQRKIKTCVEVNLSHLMKEKESYLYQYCCYWSHLLKNSFPLSSGFLVVIYLSQGELFCTNVSSDIAYMYNYLSYNTAENAFRKWMTLSGEQYLPFLTPAANSSFLFTFCLCSVYKTLMPERSVSRRKHGEKKTVWFYMIP